MFTYLTFSIHKNAPRKCGGVFANYRLASYTNNLKVLSKEDFTFRLVYKYILTTISTINATITNSILCLNLLVLFNLSYCISF